MTGCPIGRGEATSAERAGRRGRARAVRRAARRGRTALPCSGRPRQRARGVRVAARDARRCGRRRRPAGRTRRRRRRAAASSSAAAVSRPSRSGSAAASTIRRTIASSASAGEMTYSPGADCGQQRLRGVACRRASRSAPSCSKIAERLVEMPLGDRARAGLGDQAAEREVAERGLVALAEQIEQRRALREVVVRVGARCRSCACSAPRRRRYSPHAAGATLGIERVGGRGRAAARLRRSRSGGGQRFGRDQRRLQRVERRRARPAGSRRRARPLRRGRRAAAPAARRARGPTTRTSWLVCAAVRAVGIARARRETRSAVS